MHAGNLRLAGLLVLAAAPACQNAQSQTPRELGRSHEVIVVERSRRLVTYPCMNCHDKVTPRPTTLPVTGKHSGMEFKHYSGMATCYLCHDRTDLHQLVLLTQKKISLDHAYELCGQCHGEKLRDWRYGAHGKQVGSWSGKRYRYNCTECHDAHHPAPPQVRALPAPPFPRLGIRKGAH
ncbi:MAG: hypothetical protein H6707_20905 [Deltaproteobacteria bacterium]|nr:hypothetical protein [Deltaproteobacteria bacterium]